MSTDLFEGLSRDELMAELGWRMSRISENTTCEVWHYTLHEDVPRTCYKIVATGRKEYVDGISVVTARLLVALADRLGHWVVPKQGELGWKPYVPKAMKKRATRTGHKAAKPPECG
jgi:hypothetical protein